MKCQECVKSCKEQGGMCLPPDPDHVHWYEQWMYDADKDHVKSAHVMTLIGGFHRCEKGHRVEAHPADAMRAAGQVPMI